MEVSVSSSFLMTERCFLMPGILGGETSTKEKMGS
jgi:hypothetical protein